MLTEVYLDNNATSPPLPEVVEATAAAMRDGTGNPSSPHRAGRRAGTQLAAARESMATLLGTEPGSVVFTSGGTESNNMVLRSAFLQSGGRARLVTLPVEHHSVLTTCEHLARAGAEVVIVPVDSGGLIVLEELRRELRRGATVVSIQYVNNETGVVQPVGEIGALCREFGVPFHSDAAQAVGKLRFAVEDIEVDYLTVTAHKFHGPQGVGALYVREPRKLKPLLGGGDQENGLRPGTQNLPGIVGMGCAAKMRSGRLDSVLDHMQRLRDSFEEAVLRAVPDCSVNGKRGRRVCNTSNLRFRGIDGQALVAQLDQRGVCCSQSSACTSMRPEPSHVLTAMGLTEEEAYESVRFSTSELNSLEEVELAADAVAGAYSYLRKQSASYIG